MNRQTLTQWTSRERRLLTVVVLCAVIVFVDIAVMNIVGDVSSTWWPLAVPIGLLVVPIVGIACLVMLVAQRRVAGGSA